MIKRKFLFIPILYPFFFFSFFFQFKSYNVTFTQIEIWLRFVFLVLTFIATVRKRKCFSSDFHKFENKFSEKSENICTFKKIRHQI